MNQITIKHLATGKKNGAAVSSEIVDDVLCMDCRSCTHVPEVRSNDCIRCIIAHISQHGNANKVKLRTSRDLELSGFAVEILCEMASLDRSSNSLSRSERSHACSGCSCSCAKVFNVAWAGFPDPYFDAARSKLMNFKPSSRECEVCVQKTYRSLDQSELGLKNIKRKTALEVARTGGV
ncbi:MAG: hypothetical protein LBV63_01340 [Candidatus Methanoplasma sp.]|nr:hypothetical protein [Candidatus Methanoplasma sp.]